MSLTHAERFWENIQEFMNFIYDVISRAYNQGYIDINPNLVPLVSSILSGWSKDDIIEGFIENSIEHWDQIHRKDLAYIQKYAANIFSKLPSSAVKNFQDLINAHHPDGTSVLDSQDTETIWEFFYALVKISVKYIHWKRKPILKNGLLIYQEKYLDIVDLNPIAAKWQVTLTSS